MLVRTCLAALLTSALLGCGGGSSSGGGGADRTPTASTPAPDPAPTAAEQLREDIANLEFGAAIDLALRRIALRDPENVIADGLAVELGLQGTALSDISLDYREATIDLWQVLRDYLDDTDPQSLDDGERTSYDVLAWQADAWLAEREFLHFEFQGTYMLFSVPSRTERFFSDLHPRRSRDDARDYLARLALVDDKIDQLQSNLRRMRQLGVIEPAPTLQVALSVRRQLLNASLGASPYYGPMADAVAALPGVDAAFVEEFEAEAARIVQDQIRPAYRELIALMESLLQSAPSDIGVGQFEGGDAYYRQRLAYHTTTSLGPEEIHQLGLDELARVHAELRQRFAALGYPRGESLAQGLQRAVEAGGIVAAEDAVATYEAIIRDARTRLPALFERLPDTPVQVIGGDQGGFYIAASLDGSRPGAFYASTTSDQVRYTMRSLAYHEAEPGHHLQNALARETELPLFRRVSQFTGYGEGWALYAERLAGEYGWYEGDPTGDIGRLWFEALRAARLVVDTGIHHYGWGFEESVAWWQDNVGVSRASAEGNIGRYSAWPGQATAYMVGMLELLELRDLLRDHLGGEFDIRRFHSLVLDQGPMPLDVLGRRLREVAGIGPLEPIE